MPKKPAAKKASTWRDLKSDGGKRRRKIPLSLRAKLRAAGASGEPIRTHRGLGYALEV